MLYPFCVLRLSLQNVSSSLHLAPILKKLSQPLSSSISAYVDLVINATMGPKDLLIDDNVPVMDDSMLGVVVFLSQMVMSLDCSFCSFFSGMVNCMLVVLMCTPSHSPCCVGVRALFSSLTRNPAACRSLLIAVVLFKQSWADWSMLNPSSK